MERPQHMTDVVATCGGSSVCFINVDDGEVVLKYNRNAKTYVFWYLPFYFFLSVNFVVLFFSGLSLLLKCESINI